MGCDLVEVSPPYDTTGTVLYIQILLILFILYFYYLNYIFTGNTALTGANLLFEMMCVLPKVKYY